MTDILISWIKEVISQPTIKTFEKTSLNGYSARPEVWEAVVSLTDAHKLGGSKSAKQSWDEVVGKTIPDIAEKVNRPKLIKHISEYEQSPSVEWLIKNEVPKRSIVVLYGASGACKSFQAVDYGGQIALNENFIYVAGEGQSGYFARYAAWLKHNGYKKPGKFFLYPKSLQLLKQADVDAFIEEASELKPSAIVIDTLARCMVGGDENNQKDMGLFVFACEQIQQALDCTVIIVHHTGKAGDNERGSSVLRGAADMMIAITNEEGIIKIACGKSKDTKPFMHRYCRLQEVEITQNGKQVVSAVLENWQQVKVNADELTPNQAHLLECLSSELFSQGVKAPDLKGYSNIQGSSFYKALNSLLKRGYVRKIGTGAKIDPIIITNMGKDWIRQKSKINPEEMHDERL
jgi:hypothetical protein